MTAVRGDDGGLVALGPAARSSVATRRSFLSALCCVLAPGALSACSSKRDIVGRVNAGAEPDGAAPSESTTSEPTATGSEPFDAGAKPPWFERDAGHDFEVIVRARLAPPDAPGAVRWPLPRPLMPFEPEQQQPAPSFSAGAQDPAPFFDPDAGFDSMGDFEGTGSFDGAGGMDGAGGHDEHDDPMWDGQDSEPHPSSSADAEDRPEPPQEIVLRFFGRDADALVLASG
jgi:hypothetical protein